MKDLRLRFQLTPLLDLLLIVIFAQFLEGREADRARGERAEEAISRTVEEIEAADAARAAALAAERARLAETRETLEERNAALIAERDRAVEVARQAVRAARDADAATDRSASLLADVLDVSADALRDVSADAEAVEHRVAALKERGQFEVLRFLVGYEELLKRAEVWTLHVRRGGFVALSTGAGPSGGRVELLRLEARGQAARADEFVRKLFAAYKTLPQPKGLVVLLVSFDRAATAGVYQPVLDGLGEAVRRLEADQGGRTQFEFAVLGAAPEPAASEDEEGDGGTGDGGEPRSAGGAAGGSLSGSSAPPTAPPADPPR